MKKRVLAGIMAVVAMAAALPVYAQENSTTKISAQVASVYTLTIPTTTEIGFNAVSTDLKGVLKVTGNVLPTEVVTVSAVTNPLQNLVQGTELAYKLMNETDVYTRAEWNEEELRSGLNNGEGKEVQLSIAITEEDWNKAEAGTYKGSIVFTASMQEKQGD